MGRTVCLSGLDVEMLDLLVLKYVNEKKTVFSRSKAVKKAVEEALGIVEGREVEEWKERLSVKRGVDRGMENLERMNSGGGGIEGEGEPNEEAIARAIKEAFGNVGE